MSVDSYRYEIIVLKPARMWCPLCGDWCGICDGEVVFVGFVEAGMRRGWGSAAGCGVVRGRGFSRRGARIAGGAGGRVLPAIAAHVRLG